MEIKESNFTIVDAISTGEIKYAVSAPKKKKKKIARNAFEWIDSIIIALAAVILLFTFFFGKVSVEGRSMEDTLHDGDQLIISNFAYTPDKGDIVIISRNPENSAENAHDDKHKPIVKRVIAVGGDTVEIKNGSVFVNGKELNEPYTKEYSQGGITEAKQFTSKQTVPENRVFVLGDNRNDSHDSRSSDILFVENKYIIGKVLTRFFPFDKIKGY